MLQNSVGSLSTVKDVLNIITQPPKSQYMHDDKEIRGKTTNKQRKQKTSSQESLKWFTCRDDTLEMCVDT